MQLQAIVLQTADPPTGWKGPRYKTDPRHAAGQAAMVKCMGARNTDPHKVAEAHSDDFALGDARNSSSATSYQSQSDLDADLAMPHSPKLSSCYDQLIQKTLAT
jgi:hypothetical protein